MAVPFALQNDFTPELRALWSIIAEHQFKMQPLVFYVWLENLRQLYYTLAEQHRERYAYSSSDKDQRNYRKFYTLMRELDRVLKQLDKTGGE